MAQNATNPNQGTANVGTSSVDILAQLSLSNQRTQLVITNTSTGGQVISIAYGKPAAAGEGIVLYPGGSIAESYDGSFLPNNQQVSAIASASGGTVAYHERTTDGQ